MAVGDVGMACVAMDSMEDIKVFVHVCVCICVEVCLMHVWTTGSRLNYVTLLCHHVLVTLNIYGISGSA